MSTLTIETIREMMKGLRKSEPDVFGLNPIRPAMFAGRNIYDAPPPRPRLEVRDIKLSDGTSILPPEFRAKLNAALLEGFGFRDDPFRDNIYLLGSYGMVMRPEYRQMITSLTL